MIDSINRTNNIRKGFLAAALFLFAFSVEAEQADSLYVHTSIIDAFTKEPITEQCIIQVYDDHGTLLADSIAKSKWAIGSYEGNVVRKRNLQLRYICEGYDEEFYQIHLSAIMYHRKDAYSITGPVALYPKTNKRVKELSEVTVTATRLKMVMKGDTIEYDAGAFQLADGSMLDNLIRVLPGAEIDENGRITVDGKFVSSLLLNGKDFFRGDPRVALSNLPAYTVNKISVYHKSDEMAGNKNMTPEDLPWVMDVRLKREYAKGLISNYEVGVGSSLYGTADLKWLGRLFAMYFTPLHSIAVYANANNLNDTRAAGSDGEWQKVDAGNGEITIKSAGLNYVLDNTAGHLKFSTSIQAERRNEKLTSVRLAETYLEGGNTSERSEFRKSSGQTSLNWYAELNKKWDWGSVRIEPKANYLHNNRRSHTLTARTNMEAMGGETETLLYDRLLKSSLLTDDRNVSLTGALGILSPLYFAGRDITFAVFGDYASKTLHISTYDRIKYPRDVAMNLDERQRTSEPGHSYRYGLTVEPFSFNIGLGGRDMTLGWIKYTYEQRYESGDRTLERLDMRDSQQLATPSGRDAWICDLANSYHTTRLSRWHRVDAFWLLSLTKFKLQLDLPFSFVNRRIYDRRDCGRQRLYKHNFVISPVLTLSGPVGKFYEWRFRADLRQTLPEMTQMLSVIDSSDPLLLNVGNPALKKAMASSAALTFSGKGMPKMKRWEFSANYERRDNMIAMASTYDRKTGITTLQPKNINGNYEIWASLTYSRAIDRHERLYFTNRLAPVFERSVDYSSDGTETDARLKVNNFRINENLTVTWNVGSATLRGRVKLQWSRLHSLTRVFDSFSYLDVNYGVSVATPLLWGIDLQTDLMAYCRRGYSDMEMNTTDWVWNLTLSKSFGHAKQFVVKATGFDILHQLPNVKQFVNAQGRTETRYNTIPAYAVVSLTYRLDIKPQNQ